MDDATYASTNVIVQDPRYYSCVANMVLLPAPLKAFTDVMPEVKAMLRACAFQAYGWRCEHDAVAGFDIDSPLLDDAYPVSWPRKLGDPAPLGTAMLTPAMETDARNRIATIRRDLDHAGPHYPRDQVRSVMAYWNVEL